MNVVVVLEKESTDTNPVVYINGQSFELVSTITYADIEVLTPSMLTISRLEPNLYDTNKTCLSNCVYVKQIVLDDFWEINERNHCSVTAYDQPYVKHVSALPNTFELTKTEYNNALFFNGSLCYNITKPVRKMFFK